MKELHVVTDLQFGSTGKGLFAGWLAKRILPDTIITAWGPNAGHTFIDWKGNRYVNIALPNGIVAGSVKRVLLGPGSVINPEILSAEILEYRGLLVGIEILIHEHAAVVTERHRELEAITMRRIGSTMKGVGAALAEKIARLDTIIARDALKGTPLGALVIPKEVYNRIVDAADRILVEGHQGYSLSINHGMYPYVTSRDCTTGAILNDCGLPYGRFTARQHTHIYGVARTFPIRVANRFDENGKQVGFSGPGYPDQEEIKWEAIGVPPELTTVTKLPRRLFTFSKQQVQEAIRMNGVDSVFLNFVNYAKGPELQWAVDALQNGWAKVRWLGYGPREDQVKELQ